MSSIRNIFFLHLTILCLLAACSTAQPGDRSEAIVTPTPPPRPTATATPFVFEIASPSPGAPAAAANNLDDENQRIANTAFDNFFSDDSARFQANTTWVLDWRRTHIEMTLNGSGGVRGLANRVTQFGITADFEGTININGQRSDFEFQARFDAGSWYFRVRQTPTRLPEVADTATPAPMRITPWLSLDAVTQLDAIIDEQVVAADLAAPVPDIPLPDLEELLTLISFADYITTRRVASDAGTLAFQRYFDLLNLLTSPEVLALLLTGIELTADAPDVAMLATEFTAMGELLRAFLPRVDLTFRQEVRRSDLRLLSVRFDFDLEADENQMIALFNDVFPGERFGAMIDGAISFSGHGEPVEIETPNGAIPLDEYQMPPAP